MDVGRSQPRLRVGTGDFTMLRDGAELCCYFPPTIVLMSVSKLIYRFKHYFLNYISVIIKKNFLFFLFFIRFFCHQCRNYHYIIL